MGKNVFGTITGDTTNQPDLSVDCAIEVASGFHVHAIGTFETTEIFAERLCGDGVWREIVGTRTNQSITDVVANPNNDKVRISADSTTTAPSIFYELSCMGMNKK